MYVQYEGQKLYPQSWVYNCARLMTALAKIVEDHDGTVKTGGKRALVHNGMAYDMQYDAERKLKRLEERTYLPEEKRVYATKVYGEQLFAAKRLQEHDAPILTEHIQSITFKLDGFRYYFECDSNPLFPHLFIKTPVRNNGTYSMDAGADEIPCTVAYDCMFKAGCEQEDIVEIANQVFNTLVAQEPSEIIRFSQRKRVPNTYDDGWHMENVYDPERIGKVDF